MVNKAHKKNKISLLILILSVLVCIFIIRINKYSIGVDEGDYIYESWRISEGDVLYRGLPSSQTPLSMFIVSLFFRFFGASLLVARLISACMILFSCVMIFMVLERYYSTSAALVGTILFGTNRWVVWAATHFTPYSFMIFFYLCSLFFFLIAREKNQLKLYYLSGIFLGFASLSKLLILFLSPIGLFLYVIIKYLGGSRKVKPYLTYCLGILTILIPSFIWIYFTSSYFFYNIFVMHVMNIQNEFIQNLFLFFNFIKESFLFLVFVFYSLFFYKKEETKILSLQLAPILLFFIMPSPLYNHHFMIFIPVVMMLFSIAIYPGLTKDKKYIIIAHLIVFLLLLSNINMVFHKDFIIDDSVYLGDDCKEFVHFVENLPESEYLLSEHSWINFVSKSKTIPLRTEIAGDEARSGQLKEEEIITGMREYNVSFVFLRTDKTANKLAFLKDYESLVKFVEKEYALTKKNNCSFMKWDVYSKKN